MRGVRVVLASALLAGGLVVTGSPAHAGTAHRVWSCTHKAVHWPAPRDMRIQTRNQAVCREVWPAKHILVRVGFSRYPSNVSSRMVLG